MRGLPNVLDIHNAHGGIWFECYYILVLFIFGFFSYVYLLCWIEREVVWMFTSQKHREGKVRVSRISWMVKTTTRGGTSKLFFLGLPWFISLCCAMLWNRLKHN